MNLQNALHLHCLQIIASNLGRKQIELKWSLWGGGGGVKPSAKNVSWTMP